MSTKKAVKAVTKIKLSNEDAYLQMIQAVVTYAQHPETPASVATPLKNALAEIRRRLGEEKPRRATRKPALA